jgi:hypothetical protein
VNIVSSRPNIGLRGFLFFGGIMAKRKRGKRKGFNLELAEDYRAEKYVIYIASAETGILQAGTIHTDLTDGDVYQALGDLIADLKEPDIFQQLFFPKDEESQPEQNEEKRADGMISFLIVSNLKTAFEKHGPLRAEDVIGILDVIRTSVKRWSHGMHRRGYLTYIEGFLGQMGIKTWQLSEEEVENLEFYRAPNQLEDGDE